MALPARLTATDCCDDIPVTATEFHLIGKETERGWEQAEDISTLLPSLLRYERNLGTVNDALQKRLQKMPINALQRETGLSRHTVLRARQGKRVHPRLVQLLRIAVRTIPSRKSRIYHWAITELRTILLE
jgi:hypothetical protein